MKPIVHSGVATCRRQFSRVTVCVFIRPRHLIVPKKLCFEVAERSKQMTSRMPSGVRKPIPCRTLDVLIGNPPPLARGETRREP